jgi:hypothetical protein
MLLGRVMPKAAEEPRVKESTEFQCAQLQTSVQQGNMNGVEGKRQNQM